MTSTRITRTNTGDFSVTTNDGNIVVMMREVHSPTDGDEMVLTAQDAIYIGMDLVTAAQALQQAEREAMDLTPRELATFTAPCGYDIYVGADHGPHPDSLADCLDCRGILGMDSQAPKQMIG